MNVPYLLALGFIVGISGAIIPGPLLVYTITQTLRKGPLTGFFVIVGHALVEVAVTLVLLLGLETYLRSASLISAVSILGGAYMLYTAYTLHTSSMSVGGRIQERRYGILVGGIIFTAFNPSFPLWWATAGARLILEGIRDGGTAGALLVLIGHWGADFGYYLMVSHLVHRGKEKMAERYLRKIKDALALILLSIGLYFVKTGLTP